MDIWIYGYVDMWILPACNWIELRQTDRQTAAGKYVWHDNACNVDQYNWHGQSIYRDMSILPHAGIYFCTQSTILCNV